ncbi:MAG: transporter [Granulosicoccus sp.]
MPGNELFGGQYRAFLSVPFVDIEGENVATPFGLTNSSNSGLGGIELRPIDISWETSPGVFINAGLSAFTPGDWSATELVNPGQNFWSISPTVGTSYLCDGWNETAHLMDFANLENEDNGYTSGDEIHLNLKAMKDIGNDWSIGAVGFIREQVSDDKNTEMAFGGLLGGDASQRGAGLSVTKQIGPFNLNAMFTTDVSTRNSGGGDRIWLNAIIPLKLFSE